MGITATNLFAGPADVFVGPFGATEPLHALALPVFPFRDVGATGAEASLTIGQTYVDLVAEQIAMAAGAELSEQMTNITVSFAEQTMPNLRTALNMPNPVGTSEVQTISLGSATAGTIAITVNGQTTGAIAYNASAATVQTALESLSNVDAGDIVVTGGPLPAAVTLTFGGSYAGTDVGQVTVAPTGLTGGTVTVATGTQGAPGPTLAISGKLLNTGPNYTSVLLRGRKPGGGMRHAVARRCLSTENIALAWKRGEQKFIPVTFKAYYVSDSIDAVWVEDRQA
ncbi:hypothetical protein [Blastococcus sp. CT_GayMR16]|uniref:hypothetical protein n=1 Tax=Blastococcus sp. CT_GayMR16 TaxID=2559607 RepID=UPI0010746A01|nr:hypothetical protein [Blastococcus sp. CT_GayMR16]TFV90388.1 hypothetical protein E4P38_02810 [Blastococcus sp. CT_GayMR16]